MSDVKSLLGAFEKKYKQGMTLTSSNEDPLRISTGLFAFDLATGGGFPVGRTSVVYGPESSMKSTICLKSIARAQKLWPEKTAMYVDVEGAYSGLWAEKMGVDIGKLIVLVPDTAERMVDMVESLLYATDVSVVVVDSLAALVTGKELDSDAEDAMVGTSGLLINKFYRKTTRALNVARQAGRLPTLICVNQIRYKIGVLYGDPETMPGGPSFKFASSLTVRLYGKDEVDKEVNKDLPAFKVVSVIVKKHKVPIVARSSEFRMAVIPNPTLGLEIGEAYDWNTVLSYLKASELLVKDDKKWRLTLVDTGEVMEFLTQDEVRALSKSDPELYDRIRQSVVAVAVKSGAVVGE